MSKSNTINNRSDAEQAIRRILKQYKIQIQHSDECIAEAVNREANPGFDDPDLAQWQALPFITIDNPDSRDLDQALLIETTADKGYRVRYALADAAYYIPPGSELFREAMRRGVTYYTPLLAAPMLPESLSSGLISLNPHVDRRALVFDIILKDDGVVLNTSVTRALICSQGKLSYASVQEFLDAESSGGGHEYTNTAYASSLLLLREVGEKLIQRARDRDVIPFNRSEAHIQLTDAGITLSQRQRVRTEKYNEQISLLCNMQGAEMLQGLSQDNEELQAIFRAHDAPLAGRLSSLRRLLNDFTDHSNLSDQWRWNKDQSLADYVTSLPDNADTHGKVIAIERQILVSNQASEYRSEPGRHHALAATSYARFSSPMREIVGIFTHKELLEALGVAASNFGIASTGASHASAETRTTGVTDARDAATETRTPGITSSNDASTETRITDTTGTTGESDITSETGVTDTTATSSIHSDNALREEIIAIANQSRQTQKQINKAVSFYALQSVLESDLENHPRPERQAIVMGFKRDRIYLTCDAIAVDLKVSKSDIESQYQTTYEFGDFAARPASAEAPLLQLGDTVAVSTHAFDEKTRRYQLHLRAVNA